MSTEVSQETEITTKPTTTQSATAEPVRETFSREYVSELREEIKSTRLKAKTIETETAARIAELEGQMTKSQQATANRIAFAEAKALAVKEGIVDTDALKLIDTSKFVFDDNGDVTNAADVIADFKKSKPHFFGSVSTSSVAKTPTSEAPAPKSVKELPTSDWEKKKKELGL